MFSTPGSPARFAREIGHAFGVGFSFNRGVRRQRTEPLEEKAAARMSLSPSSPAPLPTSAADGGATGASERDERTRLQQLYDQHSPSLVRQLARKTGCLELARELANEAFLRLLRMAPGGLARIEQPQAFLRHVSANLLRDWGRAKALQEQSLPTLEVLSDQQLDQVAALESRDMLRRLEHAVEKMKPRRREIFLAHRLHGFTYAEIAERTGLSVKGVEKQMSKAIAKIDRLLDRG
jgi:RNA polymerase sigma factor (sigma-70 family)